MDSPGRPLVLVLSMWAVMSTPAGRVDAKIAVLPHIGCHIHLGCGDSFTTCRCHLGTWHVPLHDAGSSRLSNWCARVRFTASPLRAARHCR
eukprot:5262387-Alexandrium_andersonii.AAC.1